MMLVLNTQMQIQKYSVWGLGSGSELELGEKANVSAYSNLQSQLKLLPLNKLGDLLVVLLRLQFIDLCLAGNQGISGGEMG